MTVGSDKEFSKYSLLSLSLSRCVTIKMTNSPAVYTTKSEEWRKLQKKTFADDFNQILLKIFSLIQFMLV